MAQKINKKTQSKAPATISSDDWTALIAAPAGEYHDAVKAKLFPRETEMKLAARRAYETAPIGKETPAIWEVIKGYKNLEYIEIMRIAWSLPSRKVEDELLGLFRPIHKARLAQAERRELARRQKVLAWLAKKSPLRVGKRRAA